MTHREMFEKSFQRPSNYYQLSGQRQWEIDEGLGILDWSARESDLTQEDCDRFNKYFDLKKGISPSKT